MTDITPRELRLFRNIIYEILGINFTKAKEYLLKEKLKKLLKKSVYSNLHDLYDDLKSNDEYAIETLIRYITTNHTFFNRESDHFDFLIKDIQKKGLITPIIWCAASSTGEEVYSIVIKLLEHGIVNFKIMATDIDSQVLRKMKDGIYCKEKITGLNPLVLYKYFKQVKVNSNEVCYQIIKRCKKNVIVKKVNLIDKIVFEKKFDYIFCRNVMIYFDDHRKNIVINNLLRNLKKNGYIFTGHSESLMSMSYGVESVFSSVYRRRNNE